MLRKSACVLVLLSLAMATEGRSQAIRVGPQIGFHKASDADNTDILVGAALRLKLSSALGVEGAINYRQEDFVNNTLTVRSWPIMVTGMIYPLPIVYGAVGAGWHNATFDFDNPAIPNETKQDFGWHFGGGLELPFGNNMTLAGDIRYVFLDYDFEELPFQDVNSNFYVINAGLLFGL